MPDRTSTFQRYFITGIVTLLPLWLTLSILWIIFKWISGFAVPFLMPVFRAVFEREQSIFLVRLTSFFITVLFIWVVGGVATHIVGRRFLLQMESLFIKLPILRDIYLAVRKFIQFFYTQKQAFKRVVLVEFPRRDAYAVGFITAEVSEVIRDKMPAAPDLVNVFIPTVPNPTTGFLIMVRQKDLLLLDIGIDEAFQLIISGGILAPVTKTGGKEATNLPGDGEQPSSPV